MAPSAFGSISESGVETRGARWHRMRYRVEQFGASLWPTVSPQEIDQATAWLTPAGFELFQRMIPRDQRHSFDVASRLRSAGHDQSDLLAAALLHDAAKTTLPGRRLKLVHRVAVVLMEAARPGWVAQVARAEMDDWRYPFYLHVHHPKLGAQLAEEAGCSQLTVQLICRHQVKLDTPPENEVDQMLLWLQAADDAS